MVCSTNLGACSEGREQASEDVRWALSFFPSTLILIVLIYSYIAITADDCIQCHTLSLFPLCLNVTGGNLLLSFPSLVSFSRP